jgi:hypothetical protein
MSRKEKRMQDIREAKDRKMKKVAAGLGVVLVAVLAFEVPPMLKGSGGGSSTPPAATTTGASTATAAPATTPPGVAASAVTPVASSKLPNSDTQPKTGKSQLYSFSQFNDKDPFVQQVSTASGSLSTPSTGSSSSAAAPTVPIAPTAAVSRNVGDRNLAVNGAARIAINGRVQVVRIGASFPSANPLFKLVANSHGVARIGIATGSYASGAKTVSLVAGRTLTLVDTADGIRYQLRLLP